MDELLRALLLIIVIVLLIGALPTKGYSGGRGYYPSGGLGILLLIVIILVVMGRIYARPPFRSRRRRGMPHLPPNRIKIRTGHMIGPAKPADECLSDDQDEM